MMQKYKDVSFNFCSSHLSKLHNLFWVYFHFVLRVISTDDDDAKTDSDNHGKP